MVWKYHEYSVFLRHTMNQAKKETLNVRILSVAFYVITLGIFKPFGLSAWQWEAYLHLLLIWVLGIMVCAVTECILKYIFRMPRSLDRGIGYIIRRNLWFQLINTPLVSLVICFYRHFVLSARVDGNSLSWSNYLETLIIMTFCSYTIGVYWRFKYRSRFLAAELEEAREMNEQLKKLQRTETESEAETQQTPITLEGNTNESISLDMAHLLYIESVGNYVKIYQLQDDQVQTRMLRTTMKQMEETLQTYATIVRCHRAFIVNLGQVEKISSTAQAMQLVMQHCHDTIPVSRSNISKLKKLLEPHISI